MKISKIFTAILLVVVVSCVGVAVAAEASIEGHTFTIPDGFNLSDSSDDMVILQQEDNHAIVIMMSDEVSSVEDAKENLESKGYTFTSSKTCKAHGKDVIQQNYETPDLTIMAYVLDVGSEKCIVTYTIPSSETPPEGCDNPATVILNTIE